MIPRLDACHRYILLLCLALALAGCAPLARGEQTQHTDSLPLKARETAGQTFQARFQGLNGIAVFLKPGPKDGSAPGERLVLRLLPAPGAPGSGKTAAGETQLGPTSLGIPPTADDTSLAVANLALAEVDAPGYYRFEFPFQADSAGQDYYIELSISGNGERSGPNAPATRVRLGAGPAEAYLNGSRYQDSLPEAGQLAFKLLYDPPQLAIGLTRTGLTWLLWLAAGGFLLLLPGWGVLAWLLPGWQGLSWGERLGLAGGASLAFSPLLWLWTDLLGAHLGALYAWGPGFIGLAALILLSKSRGLRRRDQLPRDPEELPTQPPLVAGAEEARGTGVHFRQQPEKRSAVMGDRLADLAWWLVFGLLVLTRFWPARWLETPMWGDGYHHTLIARLLVDHGGLFQSWAPYAELRSFTYHFGFHTMAAGLHWLTGLSMPQATLWSGQLVNLLAVLALYPLAARLGGNRWAGIGAMLVAGLLVPLPQVYANWGRYTQLAGQAILPVAVWLAWEALGRSAKGRMLGSNPGGSGAGLGEPTPTRFILLAALVFAGLGLTHYRVLIFACLFIPAWVVFHARWVKPWTWFSRSLVIGLGAFLFFLPWFLRLYGGKLMQVLTRQAVTPAAQTPASVEAYNSLGSLSAYLPGALWWLLGLAALLAVWRRARGAQVVILWWSLIVLAANPDRLGLPGTGILSNFAVFIGMYFPAGALIGAAFGWGMHKLNLPADAQEGSTPARSLASWVNWLRTPASWATLVIFALVLALAILGARRRVGEIQPGQFALVTAPDSRAAAWIQAELPQGTRFLVNSFFAYSDSLVVGSDAGWWLPALAERPTTLPPATYSSETGPRPDYIPWTNSLVVAVRALGPGNDQTLRELQARGVTHVYIGQRQGQVGGPALLDPHQLLADPHFRLVYRQDRVWVFAIEY